MRELINSFDKLPLLFKLILCIPALHIVWAIYRIVCAVDSKNITALIIAIILLFIPIMWIIDLVCVLLRGNVWLYKAA